ncbi:MAG: dihydroneopterin aldolase [Lachnospiraceae bacterium]|nr:dihydroneopterin aldolase [Lachnospiraceae bacterium]
MGEIAIKGLRMMGRHGVLDQERRVGNVFEININISVPQADEAAAGDNLDMTVNYAEVIELVKQEMRRPSKLIEAVAFRIARAIKERYADKVASGTVTVAKLAPPVPAELELVSYTYSF